MTRRAVVVLALITALLAVIVTVNQRGGSPQSDRGRLLLPALADALESISRIEIVAGGNAPVLVLTQESGRWVAANKGDYPADVSRIRAALTALSQARILEQKTANPVYYDRLGVEPVETADAGSTLLAIDAGQGDRIAVLLGNEEGQSYRYARLADDTQSYLIDRNPDLPATAANWLDTELLDIETGRIREVTVEHADGQTVRVFKDAASAANFALENMPPDRELLYTGVTDTMAGALRTLRFEDVRAATPGEMPSSVTTYRTYDGLVIRALAFTSEALDDTWIAFEAAGDPAAAAPPEDPADTAPPGDSGTVRDPQAEAASLAERLGSWQYRLPSHKVEQITRRTEDLLKALP